MSSMNSCTSVPYLPLVLTLYFLYVVVMCRSADYFDTNVLPVLIFLVFLRVLCHAIVQSIRVFMCAFVSVLVCNVKFLDVEVLQVL